MRPIIGITSNYSYDDINPYKEGLGMPGQEWHTIADDYIKAIIKAGGIPYIIPIVEDIEVLKMMLDKVDGLLATGGNDINPMEYSNRPDFKLGSIIPKRDKQDIFMAKYVVKELKKSYLGVCRGLQILNVAFGGTLHADLPSAGFKNHSLNMYPREEPSHEVEIIEDSILYNIIGNKGLKVNSLHHQGIDKIGDNLKIVAKSSDNLCEALELNNNYNQFVLGVQWHPEMMAIKSMEQQDIINKFIQYCK